MYFYILYALCHDSLTQKFVMDTLNITALTVKAHIGIHAWEQRIRQTLLLDIHIELDVSQCQNRLENTIDYDRLCQDVTAYVESHTFTLIETVAENVASRIKETFHVKKISVSVGKPHAIKNAGNVFVTIER